MILVYFILNVVTGFGYVGQTKKAIALRWRQHQRPESACVYLRNAIAKYGAGSFQVTELCFVDSPDQANAVEQALIWSWQTYAPYGYNIELGGACRNKSPEGIAAMRAKLAGRSKSPESIAKRSLTRRLMGSDVKLEAHKEKLRAYMTGRKRGRYNVIVTKRPKPEYERERIRQMRLAEWAVGGSRRRAA